MIPINSKSDYYIVTGKTDLRKGIDTLAILLQTVFDKNPFDGAYYLFCGTRKDRFKVLYWDGEGFVLLYKRFENGQLLWPSANQPYLEKVDLEAMERFLSGYPLYPSIAKSTEKILF